MNTRGLDETQFVPVEGRADSPCEKRRAPVQALRSTKFLNALGVANPKDRHPRDTFFLLGAVGLAESKRVIGMKPTRGEYQNGACSGSPKAAAAGRASKTVVRRADRELENRTGHRDASGCQKNGIASHARRSTSEFVRTKDPSSASPSWRKT